MSTSTPRTGQDQDTAVERERPGPLVRRDLVCGLAMFGVVAVFLGAAGDEGDRLDWLYPKVLSYALAAVALLLVARGLLGYGDRIPLVPAILRGRGVDVALFTLIAVVYVVLVPQVGIWVMTALLLVGGSVYLDTSRSVRGLVVSVAVAVVVCVLGYVLLTEVFFIGLPDDTLLF